MPWQRIDNEEVAVEEVVCLRRKIGIVPATSFIMGSVIGSGIFIAPKGVLLNSGSAGLSLLVWALCGFVSLLGALCYAELGTTFTKSGGHYTYLLETLGPLPAFVRLWIEFLFIRPAGLSYGTLAFARYVVEPFFTPCDAPPMLIKLVGIVGVTLVVAINCWSVTLVSRTQVVLTVIKVVALALIIVPGIITLSNGKTEYFQQVFNFESSTLDRLPLAFYSGLFAYSGWFYLNFVTEEVINPNRTVPVAIICSMVMVTVLYVLVNVAYFTVMTPAELLASDAVAITFSNRALQGISAAMPVLVAVSCLGTLNSVLFTTPRMLFVGAREGHWPVLFSMIHTRRRTPLPAVLIMYPMVLLMVSNGNIFQLINFAAFSGWFFIALTTLGMIVHRLRFPDYPRLFKVPLVVPVTFSLVCFFIVGLSLYSDPWTTGGSCLLTLTGVPVYCLTIHRSCLPACWTRVFNYISNQLQILLMVIPQEVQTL